MNNANGIDRLLKQLAARGLSVVRGEQPDQLFLVGPNVEKTPTVIEALKAFKPQLIERLKDAPPTVVPTAPKLTKDRGAEYDAAMQLALERHRASEKQVANTCRVCGKDVSDPETRERMADPLFCDRGGSRQAVRDASGNVHPESPRCPYKTN